MTAMTSNPADPLTQARKGFSDSNDSEGTCTEGIKGVYRKGKEKALEAEEGFENYVRAHPVKSMLIATGVGLAVGVILGRKR